MATVKMATIKMSETRVRRLLEASRELDQAPHADSDSESRESDDSDSVSKRPTMPVPASATMPSGVRRRQSKLPLPLPLPRPVAPSFDFSVRAEAIRVELDPIFDTNQIRIIGHEARVVGEIGDDFSLRRQVRGLAVVAQEAVAQKNAGLLLFIDVSPADLLDPELYEANAPLGRIADKVVLQLRGSSTDPTTNGSNGSNGSNTPAVGDLAARISVLRFQGFRFALGDFETTPSRLALLAALSPEYIKLDAGITRGLSASPMKRHVIEGLMMMCTLLGTTPIAEGVSTAEDRSALATLGCVLAQGPVHGKGPAVTGTTQRSATRETFLKRAAGQC